ncbi:hypothetical protein V1509DRAFT_624528 [Lipomyces kononenkoae]
MTDRLCLTGGSSFDYIPTLLVVVYSFATESDSPSNSLLFVEDNIDTHTGFEVPLWLNFLREACVMLCDLWERIEGRTGWRFSHCLGF